MVVIDSSAILALFKNEPGSDMVMQYFSDFRISAINYCEVLGKLNFPIMDNDVAKDLLVILKNNTVNFDAELAEIAADLSSHTSNFVLSLADKACLALALRENLPVLTADRIWQNLDITLDIKLIR
jgi:PIN domain nuclease of toxin-antitoxin system